MNKSTTNQSGAFKEAIKNIFAKPHLFFLVTSVFFGLTFLFLTPPLQGPDEQAHFLQAYKLSEGNFINDATDSYPTSLRHTYKTIMYNDDIRFNYKNKYEFWRTKDALKIPLNQQIREVGDGYMSGTSYSPVVYIGQSFMIFVGRLFNLAPVVLIYMARLGNLAVWIGLVYFAIKKSPIGKWPFAVLGILPMALFQGAVITADAFSLGILLVYIAVISRLFVQNRPISSKQYFMLGFIASMLALSKSVMLIFIPLALLLLVQIGTTKKVRTKRYKDLLYLATIFTVSTFLALVWTKLSSNLNGSNLPNGVYPNLQLKSLILHPGEFLFALWNTNFYEWSDGIIRSTIGTFGWVDTPMSLMFMIFGYISLFIVMIANRGEDYVLASRLTARVSLFIISLIGILYFLGVSFALYAYYSPVDYNIIVGLQGRYFIPLLALPIILFLNKNQAVLSERYYRSVVKYIPTIILSVSVVYIIMRYYFHSDV